MAQASLAKNRYGTQASGSRCVMWLPFVFLIRFSPSSKNRNLIRHLAKYYPVFISRVDCIVRSAEVNAPAPAAVHLSTQWGGARNAQWG